MFFTGKKIILQSIMGNFYKIALSVLTYCSWLLQLFLLLLLKLVFFMHLLPEILQTLNQVLDHLPPSVRFWALMEL